MRTKGRWGDGAMGRTGGLGDEAIVCSEEANLRRGEGAMLKTKGR